MRHGGRTVGILRLTMRSTAAWMLVFGAAAGTAAAQEPRTWHDPFAYCAAVVNVDAPDKRYTGPALPPIIPRELQTAFGVAPTEPREPFERGTSWRCMDGAVYACNVGANLPCDAKPAADPEPTSAMRDYCSANRDAQFIPMYVTGHDTLYDWSCADGSPRRGMQTTALDTRGFVASIWHRIEPPR